MITLLLFVLSQPPAPSPSVRVLAPDGGMVIPVTCTNCSGGGGGSAGGLTNTELRAAPVPMYVVDAGVLNVNFPATQPVSIASMPSTPVTGTFWQAAQPISTSTPIQAYLYDAGVLNVNPVAVASLPTLNIGDAGVLNVNFPASQAVTGTFWQATQNINIVDAGPPLNVNFPATQAVSAAALPLPSGAATGTLQGTGNTSLASIDGKLPALVGNKIPVDIGASIVSVTGGLTDTQLRATALPVSLASAPTTAVTGTFWQSTQPVSLASAPTTPITAAALPLPSGAATDATLSQLLDGGVGLLSTIATSLTSGQRTQVTFIAQPLNPFLPRCNPVRRTGCQP